MRITVLLLSTVSAHSLHTTDSNLSSGKTTFTVAFRIFLWIVVNIPQYVIAWRYRSKGVFWLPQGWFNPAIMWWLSFPFAPRGSVSVMTWTWACKAVLQVSEGVVQFVIRAWIPLFRILETDERIVISVPVFIPTSVTAEEEEQSGRAQPITIAELD